MTGGSLHLERSPHPDFEMGIWGEKVGLSFRYKQHRHFSIQIREEMKDELEVYHKKREALTSAPGVEKPGARKEDEDEEMDPKLKEAILKMRKLDRILGKKIKREKEVKRERILLQRRLVRVYDNTAKIR